MAENPEVTEVLRKVGETPGYRIEEIDKSGKWRVIRLPLAAPDGTEITRASKDLSLKHKGRTWENARHDLTNRTGWSEQLHADLLETTRAARKLGQSEDEIRASVESLLLKAFGWEPELTPDDDSDSGTVVKRHARKTTAAGSRKNKHTAILTGSSTEDWSTPILADQKKYAPIRAEMIGPDRAAWMLDRMPPAPYQRDLAEKTILQLAEVMKTPGAWIANPADVLCFDTDEKNANGHHRLWAVIMSGTSQVFYVAYNVDPKAYEVMDKGRRRTTRDAMVSLGYREDASLLGDVLSDLYRWFHVPDQSQWQSPEHRTVSDVVRRRVLEEHPGVLASIRLGKLPALTRRKRADKDGFALNRRAAVLAHYLISHAVGDVVPVSAWYYAMDSMECMPGTPGNTLSRYYLVHPVTIRPREKLSNIRKKDLDVRNLISAWNNTCHGKAMAKVSHSGKDFIIPQPDKPADRHTLPVPTPEQADSWREEAQKAIKKHHLADAALKLHHDRTDA